MKQEKIQNHPENM